MTSNTANKESWRSFFNDHNLSEKVVSDLGKDNFRDWGDLNDEMEWLE